MKTTLASKLKKEVEILEQIQIPEDKIFNIIRVINHQEENIVLKILAKEVVNEI